MSNSRPKIAAVATTYFKYSHAQHIVDRFLDGYGWNGEHHYPSMDPVSLYVDQVGTTDLRREREKRHPSEPKAFAVPTDESIRHDIHQHIRPLEHLTQRCHQPASGIVVSSGFGPSLLEESQLLAQKQILCDEGPVRTGCQESQSDGVHDYQRHCPKAVCHGAENR